MGGTDVGDALKMSREIAPKLMGQQEEVVDEEAAPALNWHSPVAR